MRTKIWRKARIFCCLPYFRPLVQVSLPRSKDRSWAPTASFFPASKSLSKNRLCRSLSRSRRVWVYHSRTASTLPWAFLAWALSKTRISAPNWRKASIWPKVRSAQWEQPQRDPVSWASWIRITLGWEMALCEYHATRSEILKLGMRYHLARKFLSRRGTTSTLTPSKLMSRYLTQESLVFTNTKIRGPKEMWSFWNATIVDATCSSESGTISSITWECTQVRGHSSAKSRAATKALPKRLI